MSKSSIFPSLKNFRINELYRANHGKNISHFLTLFIYIILGSHFSLPVHADELKQYVKVTAGNVREGYLTEYATDGDLTTVLYTEDYQVVDPSRNWFQLDFSGQVSIDSFRLQTLSSDRLNKAKVYLSDNPYPNQEEEELVQTLGINLRSDETFTLSPAKTGRYLIFLNNSTSTTGEEFNFKVKEVNVDGIYLSPNPIVLTNKNEITFAEAFSNQAGSLVEVNISAFDPQGDALTFSANNDLNFTLTASPDNTAVLRLNKTLSKGSYSVTISATDTGGNVGSTDITINYPFSLEDNIASKGYASQGMFRSNRQDPRLAVDGDVTTYQQLQCSKEHNWWQLEMPVGTSLQQVDVLARSANAKVYLLPSAFNSNGNLANQLDNAITLGDLATSSAPVSFKFSSNNNRFIFIKGNAETCLELYEVRAFGGLSQAPQFNKHETITLISSLSNIGESVTSITARDFQNELVTYSLVESTPFEIDSETGVISVNNTLAAETLYSVNVIASDESNNETRTQITIKTPPLNSLESALLSANVSNVLLQDIFTAILLELTEQIGASEPSRPSNDIPIDSGTTKTTKSLYDVIRRVRDNGFNELDLTVCTGGWDSDCTDPSKPLVFNSQFNEFWELMHNWARPTLVNLDKEGVRIFDNPSESNKLLRLLVLLGDKLREEVNFPMDVLTTEKHRFIRSLMADHLVYNSRGYAPKAKNMGNFSRSDFSHITPTSKTIELISRKPFRSAGVYALPGQTVSVRRNDNSTETVRIAVNSLRYQAVHTFDEGGYQRPSYPQSAEMKIDAGETISFTSVYGGPIQVYFESNDKSISLEFQNIGLHPYWNGPEDNVEFMAAISKGDYDWAEIATPLYELHSRNYEMRNEAVAKWPGGVQELAKLMMEYTYKHVYTLGAYADASYVSNTNDTYFSLINLPQDIVGFADQKGFDLVPFEIVQHFNADQPWNGYATAGNPIDSYGYLDPISHVALHETGHNVEYRRARFEGMPLHAITDLWAYYGQSMFNLARSSNDYECWDLNFEFLFNRLQDNYANPTFDSIFTSAPGVSGAANEYLGSASIIQILMAAQDQGTVSNGWYVISRVKLIGLEFEEAVKSQSAWLNSRDAIGFSTYSWEEAKALGSDVNNDWQLIAFSLATGRDLTNFLSAYGHQFTQKAKDQVALSNYPVMPLRFYVASNKGVCNLNENGDLLDKAWIPIDGVTEWPSAVDTDRDGYWDALDAFPSDASEALDSDGDGVGDNRDAFPFDRTESVDLDRDGVGNNSDLDDDGDTFADLLEIDIGSNPLDLFSKPRTPLIQDALVCAPLLGTPNSLIGTSATELPLPDGLSDRPWVGSRTQATITDIESNFSAARLSDNSVLSAFKTFSFPSAFQELVCPDGAGNCAEGDKVHKWFTLSIQQKGLYLVNAERIARGLPPFEGVSTEVAAVAQQYAELLAINGSLNHQLEMTVNGTSTRTPWERLEAKDTISDSLDFYGYAENLAYTGDSGDFSKIPVEHSIYAWIYDDSGSNWGHRDFNLSILNDNSGDVNAEGLVGFGVATVSSTFKETYVVFNAFDPGSDWSESGMTLSCLASDLSAAASSSSDTTAPVVAAPASLTVAAADQNGTPATNSQIASFLSSATATDAIDGSVVVTHNAPGLFPIGDTVVVFSASDRAGNTATRSVTVTVSDTTAPVITAPASLTVAAADQNGTPATNSQIASFLSFATATDAIDGSVVVTHNAPGLFPIGDTVVVFSASDRAGNTATRSVTVTVSEVPASNNGTSQSSNTPPQNPTSNPLNDSSTIEVNQKDVDLRSKLDSIVIPREGDETPAEVLQNINEVLNDSSELLVSTLGLIEAKTLAPASVLSTLVTATAVLEKAGMATQTSGATAQAENASVSTIDNIAKVLDALSVSSTPLSIAQKEQVSTLATNTVVSASNLITENTSPTAVLRVVNVTSELLKSTNSTTGEIKQEMVDKLKTLGQSAARALVSSLPPSITGADFTVSVESIRTLVNSSPTAKASVIKGTPNLLGSSDVPTAQISEGTKRLPSQRNALSPISPVAFSLVSKVFNFGTGFSSNLNWADLDANGTNKSVESLEGNISVVSVPDTSFIEVRAGKEKYIGLLESVRIVPDLVPEGVSYLPNGQVLVVSGGYALEIGGAPANNASFTQAITKAGYELNYLQGGNISISLSNSQRFAGSFAFENLEASGTCSSVTFTAPAGTNTSADYAFEMVCNNGVKQRITPAIEDPAFYTTASAAGIETSTNKDTGIVTLAGVGQFKPSYFVNSLSEADTTYLNVTKNSEGIAFRVKDANGDGKMDYEVISSSGVQILFGL